MILQLDLDVAIEGINAATRAHAHRTQCKYYTRASVENDHLRLCVKSLDPSAAPPPELAPWTHRWEKQNVLRALLDRELRHRMNQWHIDRINVEFEASENEGAVEHITIQRRNGSSWIHARECYPPYTQQTPTPTAISIITAKDDLSPLWNTRPISKTAETVKGKEIGGW